MVRCATFLAGLVVLLGASEAGAMTAAWKRGEKPMAPLAERAVLAYDRATRLEHLLIEVTLVNASAGAHVVLTTPTLPTVGGAPRGAFDHFTELHRDGGDAPALLPEVPPSSARSLRADDRAGVERFLREGDLAVATGFAAWLGTLGERTIVTFVAVPSVTPGATTFTFRVAFRADEPHYPFAAPLLAGSPWPTVSLVLLGETPMVPKPSAGRLAALVPATDVELPGSVVTARLPDVLRSHLGFERAPTTLWVGRYDLPPTDRTRLGDLVFSVSPHRRADDKFHLLGPPFGSAPPAAAPPSSAPPVASALPIAAGDRPESIGSRKRRTKWGASTTGGVGFLVIAGIALGYWFYKRKLS